MGKLTDPRQIRRMILLCAAVYFTSYISRINFGALILEIAARRATQNRPCLWR